MIEKKIYYHDTDCGNVVYYANYLKYLEEARTEYLLERGIDIKQLAKKGIMFVVGEVAIRYLAPARYGDKIKVSARIAETKKVTIKFSQEIKKGSCLLVTAKVVLVCINETFRPCSIPQSVKSLLKSR